MPFDTPGIGIGKPVLGRHISDLYASLTGQLADQPIIFGNDLTIQGLTMLSRDPLLALEAATKHYVDGQIAVIPPPPPALPAGGTDNQVLAKASSADYDTEWVDQSGASGTAAYTDEFKPAAAATTITLTRVPTGILLVLREGVSQSLADGHWSQAGAVLTFTDAFLGTERVQVSYVVGAVGAVGATGATGPAGPAGAPGAAGADSTVAGPMGPSAQVHEEFMPANLATTVTLSQVPQTILLVARNGVVQSTAGGNYSWTTGSVITFTDAFSGTDRVVIEYALQTLAAPALFNGAGLVDGSVTGAKIANGSVTNAKLAADTARLNLLTNGSMAIAQRGVGPFTASQAFVCDRWQFSLGTGSTYSIGAGATLTANPTGGTVLGLGGGTYVHAADSYLFQQLKFNDTQAHLRGQRVSFSMRVYANTANAVRLRISGDGTGLVASNSAFHPGGSTWQTLTMTSNVIPADASFVGAYLEFNASVSSWGACMATLVPGLVPFDFQPTHPADDLARCQRYYQFLNMFQGVIGGSAAGAGQREFRPVVFATQMGGAPILTISPAGTWGIVNTTYASLGTFGLNATGVTFSLTATAAGEFYAQGGTGSGFTLEYNP